MIKLSEIKEGKFRLAFEIDGIKPKRINVFRQSETGTREYLTDFGYLAILIIYKLNKRYKENKHKKRESKNFILNFINNIDSSKITTKISMFKILDNLDKYTEEEINSKMINDVSRIGYKIFQEYKDYSLETLLNILWYKVYSSKFTLDDLEHDNI